VEGLEANGFEGGFFGWRVKGWLNGVGGTHSCDVVLVAEPGRSDPVEGCGNFARRGLSVLKRTRQEAHHLSLESEWATGDGAESRQASVVSEEGRMDRCFGHPKPLLLMKNPCPCLSLVLAQSTVSLSKRGLLGT